MRQPHGTLRQDRVKTSGQRTHHPDDREGTAILLVGLGAATLSLLTTPVVAGVVALVLLPVLLARTRDQ